MNKKINLLTALSMILSFISLPVSLYAFDSGSTGVDGAFNPTEDIELALPPSGILNYTSINIPAGVTVTFAKNATNTPVVMLASEDITIDGILDVSGGSSVSTSDDPFNARGGSGGPGGFDGGQGGFINSPDDGSTNDASRGFGPGGGNPGLFQASFLASCGFDGGGGGGFGIAGRGDVSGRTAGGRAYGNFSLLSLIGGSGGGGGAGGGAAVGTGGGGGGGAILIASSKILSVNGVVRAVGAVSGANINRCSGQPGTGGGGSGGAIRMIATTLQGIGTITALGGINPGAIGGTKGGNGAVGRIRLEAENMQFLAITSPVASIDTPNPVFIPNLPSLSITSVAGIVAPAVPTGVNDIVLPENTPNPIDIVFASTNVPIGSTITVTAAPVRGSAISADSLPIAANGTATASIDLPNGPNVLIATTTFIVVADNANAADYSRYAEGEPVERIILRAGMGPQMASTTTFVTTSGKEFTWPSQTVALPN